MGSDEKQLIQNNAKIEEIAECSADPAKKNKRDEPSSENGSRHTAHSYVLFAFHLADITECWCLQNSKYIMHSIYRVNFILNFQLFASFFKSTIENKKIIRIPFTMNLLLNCILGNHI